MSSRAFATAKFKWLERVTRDRKLLAIDVRVAAALLGYFNERDQGGRAFPGCQRLADDIGVSEQSALRSVHRLHGRGHLLVVWGRAGRGHPHQYWMAGEKPAPVEVLEARKTSTATATKPPSVKNKTSIAVEEIPLRDSVERGVPNGTPSLEERDSRLVARAAAPDGQAGAGAPLAAAGPPPLDGEILPPSKPPPAATTFDDLRSLWVRGWPSDDTPAALKRQRKAWESACEGTDPATILAAARTWVAAFADEPRYLRRLSEWLDGRGWEKQPQPKARTRKTVKRRSKQNGNDLAATIRRIANQ